MKKTIERMANGREQAYLGVIGTDITGEIADTLNVPEGAYVTSIVMDSPAMNAGIQSGDIIERVGTKIVQNYSDVIDGISSYEPDTTVNIMLKRQSGEDYTDMTIEVTLKGRQ